MCSKSRESSGFSLLESMLALILIGLLLSGFLTGYQVYHAEQKETEIDRTYDSVRSAMNAFITERVGADLRARYPCPAALNTGPGDADFGVEQRKPDGSCDAAADGANGVFDVGDAYIGAIPTSTLGLTTAYMLDNYGNKMSYAVTKTHVQDFALTSTPVNKIEVRDEAGNIVMAPFALVSHGQDGAGAYTIEGGVGLPCQDTSTADGENCDFNDAVFRESRVKLGGSSDFYDDRLAFSLVDADDDEWLVAYEDSPEDIHTRNLGILCVGAHCDHNAAGAGDILVTDGGIRSMGNIRAVGLISSGGDIVSGQNIYAPGEIWAGQDVGASRDLIAQNNVEVQNDVNVTNNVDIGNNLAVNNDITAGNNITAGANLIAEGALRIGDNPPSSGTMGVDGEVRIKNGGLLVDSDGDGSWGSLYNSASGEGLVLSAKTPAHEREDIVITEDGKVGISTSDPKTALDVNGAIRISMDDSACTANREGAQRYNAAVKNMEFCDGDEWRPVSSGLDIITVEERLCTREGRHTVTAECPSGYELLSCIGGGGDVSEDSEYWTMVPDYAGNKCHGNIARPAYFGALNSCARVFAACYKHKSGAGYTPTPPGELPDTPINGECGSDHGTVKTGAPTNLCSIGEASAVSGSGPWAWQCHGYNGGASVSCTSEKNFGGAECSGPYNTGGGYNTRCSISNGTYPHARVVHGYCADAGSCSLQCYDGNWIAVHNTCYNSH